MTDNSFKTSFNIFDVGTGVIEDSSSNLKYFFRYNIITENGEKVTEWSSVNELKQDNASNILGGFVPTYSITSVKSAGIGINVDWTVPPAFITNKFDIYFSWSYDNGATYTPYEYTDTTTSNSYYVDIPYNMSIRANFVKVAVQIPTNIKIINTNALIFESIGTSTLPIIDGGTIV